MHARALLAAVFVAVTATSALADSIKLTPMGNLYAFNAYNVSPVDELVDVAPVNVPQSRVSIQALLPHPQAATQRRPR